LIGWVIDRLMLLLDSGPSAAATEAETCSSLGRCIWHFNHHKTTISTTMTATTPRFSGVGRQGSTRQNVSTPLMCAAWPLFEQQQQCQGASG
jgi:hypothetical protein